MGGAYEGRWRRVEEEVKGINRKDEYWWVATARVHVVVGDRSAREIGANAFLLCGNLVKVTAPFLEEVGVNAFSGAYDLRLVTLSSDAAVSRGCSNSVSP